MITGRSGLPGAARSAAGSRARRRRHRFEQRKMFIDTLAAYEAALAEE
ncbi:hypothetical protein ACFV7R_37605 [Streptomyces sp. NPDC059866]